MKIIKAQKIPKSSDRFKAENLIARFCYHYPAYTYSTARKLPYKRMLQMLKVADKEQAKVLYNLTRAIAGLHTKKGAGITTVLNELSKIINS